MQMAGGNQTLVNMSMWSSDYPHSVTLWPDSRKIIAELVDGMTEPDIGKVLYANAARVYKYN